MTVEAVDDNKPPSPSSKQESKKRHRENPSSSPSKKKTKAPISNHVPPSHILIIDNGGDTLKYGWITDDEPRFLPNVTARLAHQITLLAGDELARVQNPNSLIAVTRSLERGLICNMANQMQVWKRLLDLLGVIIPLQTEAATALGWKASKKNTMTKTIPSHSIAVLLLIPPHCPRLLIDQITFAWLEDFGVAHVGFANSAVCASQPHPTYRTSCTVDLGWSSSLIVPTFRARAISAPAIRRLPIGGRHLVNILKYYMSYRQYNLMDQDHILRDVVEQLSYVSLQFEQDLNIARHKPFGRRFYDREFVLPNHQTTHQGQIRIPTALQKELERSAAAKAAKNQEQVSREEEEEDDDDEEDDDYEDVPAEEDHDDDEIDSVEEGNDAEIPKRRKGKSDEIEENDDDDDGDDDDDEEKTLEQRRKQLLLQREEEERKRRQQEEEEQILQVSVERFTIPEILFRPSDAGLPVELVGLAPAIIQSIQACPAHFHAALYQSIHLVGGISKIPNLRERLEKEVRELAPTEYQVRIVADQRPVEQAWFGAKQWISQVSYNEWSISREEWEAAGKRKAYGRLLMVNGGVCV